MKEQLALFPLPSLGPPLTTEPLTDEELDGIITLWSLHGETGIGLAPGDDNPQALLWGSIPLLIDEVGRLKGVEAHLRAKLAEQEELV